MGEQLYPNEPRRRMPIHEDRPWFVAYDLIYDNGFGRWTQYYRTQIGARISAWWKFNISSWGGSAILYDNRKPCRGQNTNICVAEGCFGEACVKKRNHG